MDLQTKFKYALTRELIFIGYLNYLDILSTRDFDALGVDPGGAVS